MANIGQYVRIILASEFKAKAFNDADKAINKLNRNVKNLAKGFGLAFGARALANYSKQAVKAFAADDKAARTLSKTLDNLGLAYSDPAIKAYIADLERQYGVVDDLLRPAYQKLVVATGDWQKAQGLLNTALDVSAATGKDLDTVTTALSRAYLGNTTALSRLGVGLSKAELAGSDFATVQEKLNKLYGGQAALAASTYEGALNRLAVASNNATEIIGKGLIEALAGAGGGGQGGLNATLNMIEKSAMAVSDAIVGIGRTIGALGAFGSAIKSGKNPFTAFSAKTAEYRQSDLMARQQYGGAYATKYQKEAAALAKKQATTAKTQLTATKALTKAQQDALKEKKLAAIFDMEQIQIMAALQGKLTDEERKRLELQLAIQQGNVNEAQKLANELAASQGQTTLLSTYLRTLPDANNPFKSWGSYLDAIESQVSRIVASTSAISNMPATNSSYAQVGPLGGLAAGVIAGVNPVPVTVSLEVTGDGMLADALRDAINEQASSGKTVGWSQFAVNGGMVAM